MSGSAKWNIKKFFATKAGCGCGKATDVAEPQPQPKPSKLSTTTSSSTTVTDVGKKSTSSQEASEVPKCTKIGNSVAVVKESEDPYEDFRESMLQMIVEEELYEQGELQELLACLLELNSPQHHEIIVSAFVAICNQVQNCDRNESQS